MVSSPISPLSPNFDTSHSPTIIDLRSSAKGPDKFKQASKNNVQNTYPSPPSAAQELNQEADVVELRLDARAESPSSSSDSDSMMDAASSGDDTLENDSNSSVSDLEDNVMAAESAPAFDLPKMIISGLCPAAPGAPKTIPTMVLYDDRGLQLFDDITYLDEYYLTQDEIDILERDGDKIVELIPDNSVVVELGAGSLRKTVLLLNALERKRKNIRYYALDLMLDELTKSLKSLGNFVNVKTAGLWGTYEEGLAFVSSFGSDVPKTLVWLGSSIGNLTRVEAQEFITSYRKTLNVGDNWIIGIDRRNDPQEITIAYNDPKGVTRDFIMNGLDHINVILKQDFIDRNKFQYFAQYNAELGRHEAYYQVKEAHELVYKETTESGMERQSRIPLVKDELINVEYSYKWSLAETTELFEQTEMTRIAQFTSPSNRYDLHIVRKTPFYFKATSESSPACPSQQEWTELWKSWDLITMSMIQHPSMLLEKPIALRHPFLFYLGHIPVFLDTQLSRVLNEEYSEPKYFNLIFERGIDPDVDDPTKCHAHSEVPDTWPEIESIIDFRDRVRKRLFAVMDNKEKYPMTRRLARVLFMAFEHEVMHLETLMYMLVQSPNTLPPPSLPASWSTTKASTTNATNPSQAPVASWITIDPSQLDKAILTLGHDDSEAEDFGSKKSDLQSEFGWDNEHPLVTTRTPPPTFKIQSRQVTNTEYLTYLQATSDDSIKFKKDDRIPASWLIKDDIFIKTVYGPAPMSVAGDWPVSCSQIQAKGYIAWLSEQRAQNYGLPTEHELSIALKLKQSTAPRTGLGNYGFRQWYPAPNEQKSSISTGTATIADFSGPGALWDWTCTPFAPLVERDAFETSKLYPGYSSDFFDEKHMAVLGASWATHPRVAERRSFRNWYQSNYPFVFAGFRLVERM
ncbi:hypothetical protein BX616_002167 [Lobosporangium transversale]|uniref:C-type lectin protein n=1 Tax=Lobosporangium transversale TaxID=64571 RepID=A0A1Y2GPX2_9FUNG|nr:hypothetical protein BCR41DRAFT_352206 [Lobosporangium transversale]KAF9901749.1 hypothetical protein BX616_002167 [Lobosporangium transversale]ORZ18331.1 hypothetical protein BCR41DRAFT_352206 [Lobosporangium transversale]|eukprot:XP_021882126.1 hypothetical protein BCR41DRAFT_352206 [Lobosporangium transversale]